MILFLKLITFLVFWECKSSEVKFNDQCLRNDIKPLNNQERAINVTFSWKFLDSSHHSVMLTLYQGNTYQFGYVLGDTIEDSAMWLFQVDTDSQMISQSDCLGNNVRGPSYDTKYKAKDSVFFFNYRQNSDGVTNVTFQRLLDIDNEYHPEETQTVFTSGQEDNSAVYKSPNQIYGVYIDDYYLDYQQIHDWRPYHKYGNTAVWGVFVDVPIMLGRYCKTKKWYMLAHGILLSVIIIYSLVVELMFCYIWQAQFHTQIYQVIPVENQYHLVVGTILLPIFLFQLIGGWYNWRRIMVTDKLFDRQKYAKLAHIVSGIIIYIGAKLVVANGFQLYWPGFDSWEEILLYFLFLLALFWWAILEAIFVFKKEWSYKILRLESEKIVDFQQKKIWSTSEENLLTYIELLDFDAIKNEIGDKRWMMFKNQVIDLTNCVHPGGQFLWEKCQGREIARFLYGAYSLECSEMMPYMHSEHAFKMMDRLTIGTIRTISLFSEQLKSNSIWTLSSVTKYTDTIAQFGFKKHEIFFLTQLSGMENFGRYFLVKSARDETIATRPYTMILSQSKCNFDLRAYQINRCYQELGIDQLEQNDRKFPPQRFQKTYDEFPLLIKRYNSKKGFSQFIFNLEIGDEIMLNGPYGTSLGIDHNEANTVVIIAAGTGLFPFLDLLDFLLKKTLYTLLKAEKGKEVAEDIMSGNVDFEKYFQPTYKFILILSVQSQKDLIGSDIYFPLQKLQTLLPQPNFEILLSISDGTVVPGIKTFARARFDQKFLTRNIPNIKYISRFLVCGPPIINRGVPLTLISLGIPQSKIHLI